MLRARKPVIDRLRDTTAHAEMSKFSRRTFMHRMACSFMDYGLT